MNVDYLKCWTSQLERIDREFLLLSKRRYQVFKKVVKFFDSKDIDLTDFRQREEVLNKVISEGYSMGIDEKFVRNLFEQILNQDEKKKQDFLEKLKE
jgi:chorismate mutase